MEREQKKFCNSFVFFLSLSFFASLFACRIPSHSDKNAKTHKHSRFPHIFSPLFHFSLKRNLLFFSSVCCARARARVCVCRSVSNNPPSQIYLFFSSIVRASTITHTPARCVFVLNVTTSETISVCFSYYPWRCLLSSFLSRSKTLQCLQFISLIFIIVFYLPFSFSNEWAVRERLHLAVTIPSPSSTSNFCFFANTRAILSLSLLLVCMSVWI